MSVPYREQLLFSVAFALLTLPVSAQEPTTLTGTVTTEAGAPVETGTVFIGSLDLGVLTDAQGRYVLIVPAAARARSANVDVTATLIGYTTVTRTAELRPGTQVLDFVLGEDPLRITGIRVTALGMERQSRELGVATQQIDGQDLTRLELNLVNTLAGRAAGVNVTNSGPPGGSSYIVVRGENSISADNQPLFVVDGIPVNNSTTTGSGFLTIAGGYDFGNAIQDVNPEDIESLTILKGPNAAALYGSRAANGVIVIETSKGRNTPGRAEIVVSQQVTFEDELKLPNYQDTYGQGINGQFEFYDGNGNGLYDDEDQSWGPPLDWDPDGDGEVLMIPQWFSAYDATCDCREPQPWVSHPSNVDDFFRTGVTSTTNVSVAGSGEGLNGRASFGELYQEGMTPGHTQKRTSLSLAGGITAYDRLSIDASAQYSKSTGNRRPGVGYSSLNPLTGLYWFGRQVDSNRLEDLYDETRPLDDPLGGFPYAWNTRWTINPYFTQLEDHNSDVRNRFIGRMSASYEVTDWLSAMIRTGTDWLRNDQHLTFAATPQRWWRPNGWFWDRNFEDRETNTDFLLTASHDTGLPVTSTFSFGGNRRDVEQMHDISTVPQLASPGIYNVSNAAAPPGQDTYASHKRVNSLYGQADFGYDDYLFLTVTGRNDWSSTLPETNRSYFYPSVSGSFVFSEITDALPLSYGKLRAAWARVGNDTEPYALRSTYVQADRFGTLKPFGVSGLLPNEDLKPETTESWELGTELAFLNSRIGLDVTYYEEETSNQLMTAPVSEATGYASHIVNGGAVENKGWEVVVRGTPYLSDALRWESTLTWSKNWSRVKSLAEGVSGIELTWAALEEAVALWARAGEPLGQLVASADYVYDPEGRVVVEPYGLPRLGPGGVIGNVNPDWRAGWSNEISYGDVRLGFLFDWKQGGEIFSVTKGYGRLTGILAETAEGGRCSPDGTAREGYPVCDSSTGIVVDGVVETSPGVYEPNTTVVSQEAYWGWLWNLPRANLEDATYIKLRELTLTYRVPGSLTGSWGVEAVDVSLVGRNLWLWTPADHIDPETSIEGTSIQGFEAGQTPSARSFGFNVTVRM